MALNNLTMIEGLRSCEFLKKLDLTVNFISVENLERSVHELTFNKRLEDIYILGNPLCDWAGHRDYMLARPLLLRGAPRQCLRSLRFARVLDGDWMTSSVPHPVPFDAVRTRLGWGLDDLIRASSSAFRCGSHASWMGTG